MRPSGDGRRKVVLATPIAETSLTIEGIGVVIDAGFARVPEFDPRSGLTRLTTKRISRASAEQRAGRAGRLGPGVCYRLWSEATQRGLMAQPIPEIRAADLAPLALELAQWGVRDAGTLAWLDPPPPSALAQARQLLVQLGAVEEGWFDHPFGPGDGPLPHASASGPYVGSGRGAGSRASGLRHRGAAFGKRSFHRRAPALHQPCRTDGSAPRLPEGGERTSATLGGGPGRLSACRPGGPPVSTAVAKQRTGKRKGSGKNRSSPCVCLSRPDRAATRAGRRFATSSLPAGAPASRSMKSGCASPILSSQASTRAR
ncbi:MAG: helicase-related protein [Candidatus Manganitrophus sp.]|nr:helicase-related protein [Candidatus Manganitrophus sp.]